MIFCMHQLSQASESLRFFASTKPRWKREDCLRLSAKGFVEWKKLFANISFCTVAMHSALTARRVASQNTPIDPSSRSPGHAFQPGHVAVVLTPVCVATRSCCYVPRLLALVFNCCGQHSAQEPSLINCWLTTLEPGDISCPQLWSKNVSTFNHTGQPHWLNISASVCDPLFCHGKQDQVTNSLIRKLRIDTSAFIFFKESQASHACSIIVTPNSNLPRSFNKIMNKLFIYKQNQRRQYIHSPQHRLSFARSEDDVNLRWNDQSDNESCKKTHR